MLADPAFSGAGLCGSATSTTSSILENLTANIAFEFIDPPVVAFWANRKLSGRSRKKVSTRPASNPSTESPCFVTEHRYGFALFS
jgi:hypothetical protein